MPSKKDTRTERNAEIGAFSMNLWANHFHDEQIYFKNVEQYTHSGTEQNRTELNTPKKKKQKQKSTH